MKRYLLVVLLLLAAAVPVEAQHAVFVVRHAERADAGTGSATMMATDPELSDAGRARATALAGVLRESGIVAIFVTEYKRTQQTADPLAKALGLTPVIVKARETESLVAQLKGAKGHVLVIGHSNTVGDVVAALASSSPVKLGDEEYDKLFVVAGRTVARLRYGVGLDRQ